MTIDATVRVGVRARDEDGNEITDEKKLTDLFAAWLREQVGPEHEVFDEDGNFLALIELAAE